MLTRYEGRKYNNISSALNFNGTNQYIDFDDSNKLQITDNLSVELLVKITGDGTGQVGFRRGIINYGGSVSAATYPNWAFRYSPTNNSIILVFYRDTGGIVDLVLANTGTLNRDNWYHIVGTFSSGTVSIYVNSVLKDSNFSNTIPTIQQLRRELIIGRNSISNSIDYGEMELANCRIYDTVLNQDQIDFNHQNLGNIHPEVKSNCVFDWVSQNKYFKDVTDIYGLGANSIIAFDNSEQYNLDKVTAIDALHGVMNNWSDEQLKVDYVKPTNAITDFYENHPVLVDTGLKFDGSLSQRVDIADDPSISFEITDPFSFGFWFYIPENATGLQPLMCKNTSGVSIEGIRIIANFNGSTNPLFLQMYDVLFNVNFSIIPRYNLGDKLTRGKWHLAVFTYSGNNDLSGNTLYFNNENIPYEPVGFGGSRNGLVNSILRTGVPWRINTSSDAGSFVYGNSIISNVSLYNIELNSTQAGQIYNGVDVTTGKVCELPLGSAIGSTITDISGNGNDGTFVNFTDGGLEGVGFVDAFQKGKVGSLYPESRQGLQIQRPLERGDLVSNPIGVKLNNSNLPNANDSFTIHHTFKSPFPVAYQPNEFNALFTFSMGNQIESAAGRRVIWMGFTPGQFSNPNPIDRFVVVVDLEEGISSSTAFSILPFRSLVENDIISVTLVFHRPSLEYRLYINGYLYQINTVSTSFDFSTLAGASIGLGLHGINVNTSAIYTANDERYFNIGVWKRALNNQEVLNLYNNSILSGQPNLLDTTDLVGQDNMNTWHNFNVGDISNTSTLKNYGSSADSTIIGFVDQTDIRNNIQDIDELR